ncbi:hypothetical protein ABT369_31840 [Dactylosporangium sp. NPDC000244]
MAFVEFDEGASCRHPEADEMSGAQIAVLSERPAEESLEDLA